MRFAIRPPITENEVIFDIGCGDGAITAELSKVAKYGSVMGMDTSKEMIDLAKTTFPRKHITNLSFQWSSAEQHYGINIAMSNWAYWFLIKNCICTWKNHKK
jgi:ubiquinone/menaquinone biosynthesis C-methylase UbiE